MEWQKKSLEAVIGMLNTDVDLGLSTSKVAELLEKNGPNAFTLPTAKTYSHMINCTFIAFLVTVGLCFSSPYIDHPAYMDSHSYHYFILAGVLIIGAIIITVFSLCLQSRSAKIVSTLCNAYPQYTTVIRSGVKVQENVKRVVKGEIVLLRPGDMVPADLRLIEAFDLEMNEFALTGKVEPKWKNPKEFDEVLLDSPNMAWSGSYCVQGCGKGVVVSTGLSTIMGVLNATKRLSYQYHQSPLYLEARRFILVFNAIALCFGAVLFGISMSKGIYWFWSLTYLLTLSIAVLPDFLLYDVTSSLMVSTKRLATKRSLPKDLETVETLGMMSLICCSKTKFLTENVLSLHKVWADWNIVPADEIRYKSSADSLSPISETTWSELCKTLFLTCTIRDSNKCLLRDSEMDDALLYYLSEYRSDLSEYSRKYRKIFELPFDSKRKFHLCIHEELDEDSEEDEKRIHLLSLKGAPEIVIGYCGTIINNERDEVISEPLLKTYNKVLTRILSSGEKVIGICNRQLNKNEMSVEYDREKVLKLLTKFRLVALITLRDAIRQEAKETVEKCRKAGIKVSLVTGDHPISAKWMARKVGILSAVSETRDELIDRLSILEDDVEPRAVPAVVIHGDDLQAMSSESLINLLSGYDEIIFARVSPDQKQGIVEAFQLQGMSVAITGIEPQDYAAMEQANIGIAMDKISCEWCKKAANLILLDNYLPTLVTSIEEGRLFLENLKKTILYVLACKMPEAIPYVLFLSLNIPIPIGEIYLLLIFFETDMLTAMSLLYEKPETGILRKVPTVLKKRSFLSQSFLNKLFEKALGEFGITETLAGIFTYLIIMAENGFMPEDLVGLSNKWYSPAINDLRDSFNQEWTYTARKELENTSQTGFFVTIVVLQMLTLLISRTNIDSLWTLGMRNYVINSCLIFQVLLTLLLIYLPGTDILLHISPIKYMWWFPGLPFGLFLLAFEELRSFYIRHSMPGSWLEKDTY